MQAGGQSYTKVRDGKSGYLSQSLLPLYFGLDGTAAVDRVEVRWPSGMLEVLENVPAGSYHRIREGSGIVN